MSFKEILDLIVSNSLSVFIVAFYLYKDMKFNEKLVTTLQTICDKLDSKD